MWTLKRNDTNELTKWKETYKLGELTYGFRGGERMGERDSWGVRDGYIYTAVFKMDNQQGPTVRSSV